MATNKSLGLVLLIFGAYSHGVVINEIMYHPPSENPAEEYIELFAAILFMAGATFVARPTTAPSCVLSALGLMCLCIGTLSLRRARRSK